MAAAAGSRTKDNYLIRKSGPTILPSLKNTDNFHIVFSHGCVVNGKKFLLPEGYILYTLSDPGESICSSADRLLVRLRAELSDKKPEERIEFINNFLRKITQEKAKRHKKPSDGNYIMNEHILDFNDKSILSGIYCCLNVTNDEISQEINISDINRNLPNGLSDNKILLSNFILDNPPGVYILWMCRTNCFENTIPRLAREISENHSPLNKYYYKYLKYKAKYLKLKKSISN